MDSRKYSSALLTVFIIFCFIFLAATGIYFFTDTWNVNSPVDLGQEGDAYNQYPDRSIDDVYDSLTGRVPILMYHMIVTPYMEKEVFGKGIIKRTPWMERFLVSSAQFKGELESLYSAGFRNISLDEYISLKKGEIKTLDRIPPDSKLYVLTFDDGPYGQLDYSGIDKNGSPVIDPDCAVGIMMDFAKTHPDFKLNAAFAVTFEHSPFMQPEYVKDKLNRLLDLGFEIVNHTVSHKRLSWFVLHDRERADFEIGHAMELFESYLGYRAASIDKVSYPGGNVNAELWKFIPDVTYNGRTWHFKAGLDAKGLQAKNPNEKKFNIYNIARIETSDASFKKFILDAPNLYRTPSVKDNKNDPAKGLAFYQRAEDKKKAVKDGKSYKNSGRERR
jgi:peptidoglycan/xylan/chitin deacetylase (PgdA/CDA1 family)